MEPLTETGADMPSPFPGMDPFIESQAWEDFHPRAITVIADLLQPSLRGRYSGWIERRVYTEHVPISGENPDSLCGNLESKTSIHREPESPEATNNVADPNIAVVVECRIPAIKQKREEQHSEPYLVVRKLKAPEIVTVIELLSPPNKQSESDGRYQYLEARGDIIISKSHLLEIDLLRSGNHMPLRLGAPVIADYTALVSRCDRRPKAELYSWSLRHKLPTIPVPLANNDPDVPLDLQTVLDAVYDRAGYDEMLDYNAPLQPPPGSGDVQRWVAETLKQATPPISGHDDANHYNNG